MPLRLVSSTRSSYVDIENKLNKLSNLDLNQERLDHQNTYEEWWVKFHVHKQVASSSLHINYQPPCNIEANIDKGGLGTSSPSSTREKKKNK